VANLLREVIAVRGQEAVDFLENRFLPSTGCPPAAIVQLLTRVRSETIKDFKKFFTDFVKEWKAGMEA
jgi:exportin-T